VLGLATTARCCSRPPACSWRCPATCWSRAGTSCPPWRPERLGHKALAVNLSDLAACGAEPLAFTLALALPRADEAFLAPPWPRPVRAGRRARHRPGRRRHHGRPAEPVHHRVRPGAAGQALRATAPRPATTCGSAARWATRGWRWRSFAARSVPGPATASSRAPAMECPSRAWPWAWPARPGHSAIDLSDGLLGDLGHILRARASVRASSWPTLPRSAVLAAQTRDLQRDCLLRGGDDYELLFSAAPVARRRGAGRRRTRRRGRHAHRPHRAPNPGCSGGGRARARAQSMTPRGFDHFA
jgi:thiamine-monophosphate kinase